MDFGGGVDLLSSMVAEVTVDDATDRHWRNIHPHDTHHCEDRVVPDAAHAVTVAADALVTKEALARSPLEKSHHSPDSVPGPIEAPFASSNPARTREQERDELDEAVNIKEASLAILFFRNNAIVIDPLRHVSTFHLYPVPVSLFLHSYYY